MAIPKITLKTLLKTIAKEILQTLEDAQKLEAGDGTVEIEFFQAND